MTRTTMDDVASAASSGVRLFLPAHPHLAQSALEHIVSRHWVTSGAARAGKLARGTTGRGLRNMINEAGERGTWAADRFGRSRVEYNFGRRIGIDMHGQTATGIRVIVDPANEVITAFPIFFP